MTMLPYTKNYHAVALAGFFGAMFISSAALSDGLDELPANLLADSTEENHFLPDFSYAGYWQPGS